MKQYLLSSATIIGAVLLIIGLLMASWDLFVSPMFCLPFLSFGEAAGLLILIALLNGLVYANREVK